MSRFEPGDSVTARFSLQTRHRFVATVVDGVVVGGNISVTAGGETHSVPEAACDPAPVPEG